MGKYKETLSYCERSLAIQKIYSETKSELLLANTLHNIGYVYYNTGEYSQAIENFEKSLTYKKEFFKTNENLSIADTLCYMGATYLFYCGKYDKSLDILKQSYAIKLELHD